MENQTESLEIQISPEDSGIETQQIISLEKFILLNIMTIGIYHIWWLYKEWRFFKQKDNLDILPAGRAIFSIFFLHSFLNRSLEFAKEKDYEKSYSATPLFIAYLILTFIGNLPEPLFIASFFRFTCVIPAFNALNYAKQNSTDFVVEEQASFNGKQIALIVCGAILWTLVIIGMSMD